MAKHKNLKLSMFRWAEGVLEVVEHFVESLEHALKHMEENECHTYKIHDKHGEVVRSGHGCHYRAPNHEESQYC
jgi:hypothetical protein